MRSTRGSVRVFLGLFLISMSVAATARADDISGVISATRTITRDSQLVGNVTCTVTGSRSSGCPSGSESSPGTK